MLFLAAGSQRGARNRRDEKERQQLFLLECDVRPRERTVVVTVMGE